MGIPERDEYQVGSLINGLPTCVFSPKPYTRTITNIVLGNSVTSAVFCYRNILGTTPVAQNQVGNLNTLRDRIIIPAGQIFFVQWTAIGANVRDAFARVSWERQAGFLGENDGAGSTASGTGWDASLDTTMGDVHLTFIPAGLIVVNVAVETNIAGAVIPISKRSAATAIRIDLHTTAYTNGAAGAGFGVFIIDSSAVVQDNLLLAQLEQANLMNLAHTQLSGTNKGGIGLPIGTYDVQVWWARLSGAANVQMDNNDRLTMAVSEVSAL